MAIVEMRNPYRSAKRTTLLEEAITATRRNSSGCRVDGVLMKILIGVECFVAKQKVQIAMIGICTRDCVHGNYRARGAAIFSRCISGDDTELVDPIWRWQR